GTASCVGLSTDARIVPFERTIDINMASASPPQPGDTFLVTGGARGVTANCVIELARHTGSNFVLLGRSEIKPWPAGLPLEMEEKKLRGTLVAQARKNGTKVTPADVNASAKSLLAGQEIRQTLSAIEAAGGEAIYVPTDIGNAKALRAALQTAARKFGPITGLVHGAGVLADKLIAEKTADQVARVFSPKVLGLQTILSEITPSTLKHIAFFSSVAARYGNAGQSDYAMANEVLNRAAHMAKAANPKACVTSIGWGPWDGGMVDDGLRARFAEMGIELIARDAGAQTFVNALMAGAACPVELVVGSELPHG
ncbi:MAG: SDR family NAD(P)-dependent oxidoreductase, partial [Henriciella sp.]